MRKLLLLLLPAILLLSACSSQRDECARLLATTKLMRFAILLAATLLIAPSAIAQTCKSFYSCEQAVRSYRSGNSKLDRDMDGVPCESLCGKNGERMR